MMSQKEINTLKSKPFYLNVVLLNKEEVVAAKVVAKTGSGFLGKAAVFAANKLVTDEKVIENLAAILIDKIRAAVSEMGIIAEMNKVFQHETFVVISVQIGDVDKLRLIRASKGPEFADSFSSLITSLQSLGLENTAIPMIDQKVLNLVHEGMMKKFGDMIPQKMSEAGLEVECNVCASEDQADFFFPALQKLNK